jgi:O-antigen/teichoic acid export membrane protein
MRVNRIIASSDPAEQGEGSPADAQFGRWSLRRNIGWMLVAEVFNRIIPLVVLARATRRLGMDAFGQAQFVLNVLESAIPWIAFGYTFVGVLAHHESEKNRAQLGHPPSGAAEHFLEFAAISVMRCFNAIIVVGVTAVLLWSQPSYTDALFPFLWFVPFLFLGAFDPSYLYLANGQIGRFTRVTTLAKAVFYVAALLLIEGPSDKWLFVFCMMAVNATTVIVGLVAAFRDLPLAALRAASKGIAFARARNLFVRAIPFAVLMGLLPLYERAEVFAVERSFAAVTSGSFQALFKLQQSALGIVSALMAPFLSEFLRADDPIRIRRLLEIALAFGALIASCGYVFSIYFGEEFLRVFFGASQSPDVAIFEVLMLSMFPAIVVTVFGMQILALFGGKLWVAVCLAAGFLLPNLVVFRMPQLFGESLYHMVLGFLLAKIAVAAVLLYLGSRKVPLRSSFVQWSIFLALLVLATAVIRSKIAAEWSGESLWLYAAGALSLAAIGTFFALAAVKLAFVASKQRE